MGFPPKISIIADVFKWKKGADWLSKHGVFYLGKYGKNLPATTFGPSLFPPQGFQAKITYTLLLLSIRIRRLSVGGLGIISLLLLLSILLVGVAALPSLLLLLLLLLLLITTLLVITKREVVSTLTQEQCNL